MKESATGAARRIEVAVEPPYDVVVGAGLLTGVGALVDQPVVAVVSDSRVGPRYSQVVCASLERTGKQVLPIEIPAGEASKNLGELERISSIMAGAGLTRDGAILALGGGVVSDLAGFAAASYLRGVAYFACPTSLLAMVDASVGGKTGVNLPEGKNLVGAFWQPRTVVADVETLATLPEGVFREGAVELYKHGLLDDEFLLGAIEEPEFRPDGDPEILIEYVSRSIAVKARVVSGDERESGNRAHLNLGHTLAHALEAASAHRLPHGEAVAYGLLYAALLGRERGWHDFTGEARRLLEWLTPSPLPTRSLAELRPFIDRDKKHLRQRRRFVLLREKAAPVLVDDVSAGDEQRAWEQLLEVMS